MALVLKEAMDEHSLDVIRVIRRVYEEYGFTWEAGGYHADLEQIRHHYWERGGGFWVLCQGREVVGTCGVQAHTLHDCELARLYLLPELRGQGIGRRLFLHTLEWSRAHGYRRMFIWSDVKLALAHAMYLRNGARWIGQRRCNDPDDSLEHGFVYLLQG